MTWEGWLPVPQARGQVTPGVGPAERHQLFGPWPQQIFGLNCAGGANGDQKPFIWPLELVQKAGEDAAAVQWVEQLDS